MQIPDIAVIGLGVMGASLARNLRSRGLRVAIHNRSDDLLRSLLEQHGAEGFHPVADLSALPGAFGPRPAVILLMITAGPAVDAVLEGLRPHLRPGDILIDGGNSHFSDTERRQASAAGFHFVGMGISGGERGALEGPSLMPGGDRSAWPHLAGPLTAAAAASDAGPCVTWCGAGGAGHFVKMVHNGIEYGDMQLIAETWTLLREGLGWPPGRIADTFAHWNQGELESYLIELTATVVAARDPHGAGPLVESILDVAGQKGTGRWTTITATELGIPIPTISAAVDARAISACRPWRLAAAERGLTAQGARPLADLTPADLELALAAAKLMSYTQGFHLLAEANRVWGYGTDLAAIAQIWRAGCIIRARLLDRIHAAWRADPQLPLLFFAAPFAAELGPRATALRRVVAAASRAGLPTPALAASLAYLDGMTRPTGSARLIQAQRDAFGAHTYRRLDAPDTPVHTAWEDLPRLP